MLNQTGLRSRSHATVAPRFNRREQSNALIEPFRCLPSSGRTVAHSEVKENRLRTYFMYSRFQGHLE
jgi:hypothetical protein